MNTQPKQGYFLIYVDDVVAFRMVVRSTEQDARNDAYAVLSSICGRQARIKTVTPLPRKPRAQHLEAISCACANGEQWAWRYHD